MRKGKSSFLLMIIVFCLTCMFGCGAGTNNVAPGGTMTNPSLSEVQGLSKVDNSGHINAVLQMIISHPQLRIDVSNNNPTAPFNNLFAAYDRHDLTVLSFIHKQIVDYIYSLPGMLSLGAPGSALKVLQGDSAYSYNGGLGMSSSITIVNPAMLGGYDFYANIILAFDSTVYDYMSLTYANLPGQDNIKGIVYNTGGHYVAYLKGNGGNWYRVDDNDVSVISGSYLQTLPLGVTPGIEIIILN